MAARASWRSVIFWFSSVMAVVGVEVGGMGGGGGVSGVFWFCVVGTGGGVVG